MSEITVNTREAVANVLCEFLLPDDVETVTGRILNIVETFNAQTGACICTSFRWNTWDGKCEECGHESHASRIHCGAIR